MKHFELLFGSPRGSKYREDENKFQTIENYEKSIYNRNSMVLGLHELDSYAIVNCQRTNYEYNILVNVNNLYLKFLRVEQMQQRLTESLD